MTGSAMRRYEEGLDALAPSAFEAPVVTVGVFDGLHRGHRHLLEHLRAMAGRLGGESVVVTFDTHPRAVIEGAAPRSILSLPHRLLLLERMGVDAAIVLPFDDAMRAMTYETFARDLLVRRLGIRGLLFGYNGRIGHDGEGTAQRLEVLGRSLGFEVEEAPPIALDGRPISSSRIRDAIEAGELAAAAAMLDRPVVLYGKVVEGDQRGRSIGFPTANVDPEGEILPPQGVYQVVATVRGERYGAVANLGLRPTFRKGRSEAAGEVEAGPPILEVHVPGLDFEFYGERIEVELVRKIRDERRFASREALIRQIEADVATVTGGSSPRPFPSSTPGP